MGDAIDPTVGYVTGLRLAIDYGTSNTVGVLSFPDARVQPLLFDGSPLLPSAVYAAADGELLVGRDAVRSARLDPSRYEPNPKRRIDDGEVLLGDAYPVSVLIGAALAAVRREAERVAGGAVDELILTCPVAWGLRRRATLAAAARDAGLPAPTLVAEPVAAARYFASLPGIRPDPIVVYDLGAGTFDVCLVRFGPDRPEAVAHSGLADVGGIDLDELIIDRVRTAVDPGLWQRLGSPTTAGDRRAAQLLRDDARSAKETLSRHASAGLPVPLTDRDVVVGREEFDRLAEPLLARTVDATLDTIRTAGGAAGIFLVGGASRVPLVATLLHRATGIAPTILEQPETVVPCSPPRPTPCRYRNRNLPKSRWNRRHRNRYRSRPTSSWPLPEMPVAEAG